jgi:hypothetical protein
MRRRRSIVTGFAIIAALSAGCNDTAGPVTTANVVGEWAKIDNSLPPVNLSITRDGSGLHARLRLSGVEANGTANIEGRRLTLSLQGRAEAMLGDVVSGTELDLQLAPGASYRLRKQ